MIFSYSPVVRSNFHLVSLNWDNNANWNFSNYAVHTAQAHSYRCQNVWSPPNVCCSPNSTSKNVNMNISVAFNTTVQRRAVLFADVRGKMSLKMGWKSRDIRKAEPKSSEWERTVKQAKININAKIVHGLSKCACTVHTDAAVQTPNTIKANEL